MITLDNILLHELIGLRTEVTDSSNKGLIGLNGLVVDETKSMLKLNTKSGAKLVPKKFTTLKFHLKEQQITLSGTSLAKRSQDRLRSKI